MLGVTSRVMPAFWGGEILAITKVEGGVYTENSGSLVMLGAWPPSTLGMYILLHIQGLL